MGTGAPGGWDNPPTHGGYDTDVGAPTLAQNEAESPTLGADSLGGGASGPYAAGPSLLAPGTIVGGTYRVEGVLGTGGMGVVYRAHHMSLSRPAALKLHMGGADSARLVREAKAMARLNHPNVIAVYDVGALEEQVFIAMELVDGGTLDAVAQGRTWQQKLQLYRGAGEGLAAAHAVGIVHRDFKPHNVLVGRDGRVRVADFGLARAAGSAGASADAGLLSGALEQLTATGVAVGTPRYMAPEQFGGTLVDARADQFSFCVALYEALWGRPPFAAGTAGELLFAITTRGPAQPPSSAVPAKVWTAIKRGLSADPSLRFAGMQPLLAALDVSASRGPGLAIGLGLTATLVVAGGSLAAWQMLKDPAGEAGQDSVAVAVADPPPEPTPPTQPPAPPVDPSVDPKGHVDKPAAVPEGQVGVGTTKTAPGGGDVAVSTAPTGGPTQDDVLRDIANTDMLKEPLRMMDALEAADAKGVDGFSLGVALVQSSLPKTDDSAPPTVPAWDHNTTLTCGKGENLVIRGVTMNVPTGPAFEIRPGCKIRIESSIITADVIVHGMNSERVELNDCTVTAHKSVVDIMNSRVQIRSLEMKKPSSGPAINMVNGNLLVVDSDVQGDVGIRAMNTHVDVEDGDLEGATHAIVASGKSKVRVNGTDIKGSVEKIGTAEVVVRADAR